MADELHAEEQENEKIWPPAPLPVPPYKITPVAGAESEKKARKGSGLHPKAKEQPITGEQIREARKRLGLTQAQLAERVGLSRPFIALVEQGRRILSPEDLQRVREALGI